MSQHPLTAGTARWLCPECDLASEPVRGAQATREVAQLAGIHDRVHHRGARSARVVVTGGVPDGVTGATSAGSDTHGPAVPRPADRRRRSGSGRVTRRLPAPRPAP